MRPPVDIRWLGPGRKNRSGETGGSSGSQLLLRQAVRLVCHSQQPNVPSEEIDCAVLADDDLLTEPTVVMASMPEPAEPGLKAIDILLRSAGVRLLLSCPLAFVVFVWPGSRRALDFELRRWVKHGSHSDLAIRPLFQDLASGTPIGWAFLTADELLGSADSLQERLCEIQIVARSALYDVTGIRSLLHLLIGEGSLLPAAYGALPPQWAVLVEDERETAARLAMLVRRWGYSLLVVDDSDAWDWIGRSGSAMLEEHFDFAIADNVLGFEGRASGRGHRWLRSLQSSTKVFKSAFVSSFDPPADEIHIRSQVADAFEFRNRICAGPATGGIFGSTLFAARPQTASPDLHSEARSQVIGLGHRLIRLADRLEDDHPRAAAIARLEAFSLVERLDGPMAADALSRFHVFELESLCERAPESLNQNLLEARLADLRAGISRCFEEPAGEPSTKSLSVRRADTGHWVSRAFSRLGRVLNSYPTSARLHQILEIERREQRRFNHRLANGGKRSFSYYALAAWNGISRHMVSLRQVATAWALIVLLFGGYYAFREAASLEEVVAFSHLLRGLGASLSCGVGFLYPHVYEFAIPSTEIYIVEFVQRTFALILLARTVELIAGWLRYGS